MDLRQQLSTAIDKLGPRDLDFAQSLLNSRRWSDKQAFWAEKLVARTNEPPREQAAAKVAGFDRIIELFDTAAEKLRYPKIQVTEGVFLKRCGSGSKYPGAVNVTSEGGFGQATWYGRVERDGTLTEGRNLTPEVRELLQAIANDPAQAAQAYGRRTGNCCFCRKELTDQRSTEVGYGPVCAEHYGLPWGTKSN